MPALMLVGAAMSQVGAAVMLAGSAPSLASGAFLGDEEIEVVHLYGLATLSVAIFAALLHLIPVILRQRVPLPWAAGAAGAALMIGGWVMAIAIASERTDMAAVGGSLTCIGGLVLVVLVGIALVRAARSGGLGDIGIGIAISVGWFTVLMLFGSALLDNLRAPVLGGMTTRVLGAHAVIAGAGWIGGMIVAVALRLGPMLALARGHRSWPGQVALVTWHVGVALLVVGLLAGVRGIVVAGITVLTGAGLSFVLFVLGVVRHRRRALQAPSVHLILGGAALVLAGALIAAASAGSIALSDVVIPAGLCVFVGFGAGITSGHLFKLVPMVVWTGRYAAAAAVPGTPRLPQMYSRRLAGIEQLAFAAGMITLLWGCMTHTAQPTMIGADLVAAAAVTTFVASLTVVVRSPSFRRPQCARPTDAESVTEGDLGAGGGAEVLT